MMNKMNTTILAPMRMGDLANARPPAITPPTADTNTRYLPPNMRKGSKAQETSIVKTLDFNSPAFPSLGLNVAKAHNTGDFKQKVLDLLEKEALDEAERGRIGEVDIRKMTREEKIKDGGWEFVTFPHRIRLPPLPNNMGDEH